MNYRELGNSGVKVSEISFGCWTMGGLNWVNGTPNGWADVNEDEITAGIKTGIDAALSISAAIMWPSISSAAMLQAPCNESRSDFDLRGVIGYP